MHLLLNATVSALLGSLKHFGHKWVICRLIILLNLCVKTFEYPLSQVAAAPTENFKTFLIIFNGQLIRKPIEPPN